jgi:mxaA protein
VTIARLDRLPSVICAAALLVPALEMIPARAFADEALQPVIMLRDAGYLLGDLMEERIDLPLPQGFRLDADSLPLPGRVAPWLEVRAAHELPGARAGSIGIAVTYQIFAEVEQTTRIPIPGFSVRLRDGKETRKVSIPEKSFLLAASLPASLSDEDRELKPSPSAQALPVRGLVVALASALSGMLAGLAYLLWIYDRLPFLPRSPGPFARLWRRWRRRSRRGLSTQENTALLHDWHAALNESAGETLYASTLPRLFDDAPHLAALHEPIESLFERSWQYFYGTPPQAIPPPEEVLPLLRAAALRERGVPC